MDYRAVDDSNCHGGGFFRFVTALYVYFDVEERSRNRVFAALFALAVAIFYWPISFVAYIACTVILDRRRQSAKAA
ncbi:MAG: hypothetical protein IAG10_00820 [Planctomycetaceae bacterium]|nr:hypothetical protein [Planctomycetaceae bacterium]